MAEEKRKPKLFYGWWIVLGATIADALSGGFYLYGFSAFFMPLINDFGWSRAATSGAFSLSRIEGGLLGPLGGFLVDKFGPRKMMLIGMTMIGAGFILLSRIDSLVAFYLVFTLCIAVGVTLGIHQAVIVAVTNWFIKKRGMALGFASTGMGIGGALVPVLAWLIVQYGWRDTAVITGLTFWFVGIPIALMMRHRPEQYGYLPDGETPEEHVTEGNPESTKAERLLSTNSEKRRASNRDISFTVHQALRTKAFWLVAVFPHQVGYRQGLRVP